MINFENLDKIYKVSKVNNSLYISNIKSSWFDEDMLLSEAFELAKENKDYYFEVGSSAYLEDYILAKKLNDMLKIATSNRYVVMFGSLVNYINKELIKIPSDFKKINEHCDEVVDDINQVFWLTPVDLTKKDLVESLRKDLFYTLKEGQNSEELTELLS